MSVVIPAYNVAPYIEDAVRSAFSQSLGDIEVFAVDDGSTDGTGEILDRLAKEDHRLKVIHQKNAGLSAARNVGIELSKAPLIAFLDGDDEWDPHKLKEHYFHLRHHPHLGISFSRVQFMDSFGKRLPQFSHGRLAEIDFSTFLYESPLICGSNPVIRKELFNDVGGFLPQLRIAEDVEFYLRVMASRRWQVQGIPKVLVYYRNVPGLSANLQGMLDSWDRIVSGFRTIAPEILEEHYVSARAAQYLYLSRRALRLGYPPEIIFRYLLKALFPIKGFCKLLIYNPRKLLMAGNVLAHAVWAKVASWWVSKANVAAAGRVQK